jgi:hypothetical protein
MLLQEAPSSGSVSNSRYEKYIAKCEYCCDRDEGS